MVIALTTFRCLCGFRAAEDISNNLKNFPEFFDLIGWEGKSFGT
jgi:mannose-6-phosphate isomerase class I